MKVSIGSVGMEWKGMEGNERECIGVRGMQDGRRR